MGRLYRRPGSPFWWARYSDASGKVHRESTKTEDARVAREWLSSRELAALRGESPGLRTTTVEALAEAYLKAHIPPVWSQRWHYGVSHTLYKHVVPRLPVSVAQVDRPAVDAARAAWLREVEPPTVNRISASASAMWAWGISRGMVERNPWLGRHRFPEQKKAPPALTDSDLDLFCALIPNEAVRLAAIISLELGLRVGEVRRLAWEDVRGREIHIVSSYSRGLTKNRRDRWLALSERALEALERAREAFGDDLLGNMPKNYRKALHRAQDAAGVGRWRWHDLRHLALTRAARWLRRADLRAMAGWVGDESARYVHEDAQGMAAMVVALDCARGVPGKTEKPVEVAAGTVSESPKVRSFGGSSNGRTPVSGSKNPARDSDPLDAPCASPRPPP